MYISKEIFHIHILFVFYPSEYKLKTLREADINLVDFDEAKIRANLKDREHGKAYIKDGMCV